jgi:hypothetical protein
MDFIFKIIREIKRFLNVRLTGDDFVSWKTRQKVSEFLKKFNLK